MFYEFPLNFTAPFFQVRWLTKVLTTPNVHGSVIFSKVIEPGPVNHKQSACNDGGPVRETTKGGK